MEVVWRWLRWYEGVLEVVRRCYGGCEGVMEVVEVIEVVRRW